MLLQTMAGMAIGSILWFVFGFALTFGVDQALFIGDLDYALFVNVDMDKCFAAAPTIPTTVFAMFQCMFAALVGVICTGSYAEKLNFRAFFLFTLIWPIEYYFLAHWVWGGGWLNNLGVIDFAGGITIHTNSGVAGLVVALYMGRRRGGDKLQSLHHNIPLTIVGGALIWMGWFGFNGGSSFGANFTGSVAFFNTHIGACSAAFAWGLLAYLSDSYFHLTEVLSGAFAGLAAVTPGSGYVLPWHAFIIGLVAGVCGFYSVKLLRGRVQLDDVLDVASLQGTPGIVGTLLAGCFATDQSTGGVNGAFYGRPILLAYQLAGVMTAIVWSAAWTYLVIKFVDLTVGVYVSMEAIRHGQDAVETGESAYGAQDDEDVHRADHTYVTAVPAEHEDAKGAFTFGASPVRPTHRR
jgi:ammonium transporter, Amt family